MSKVVSSTYKIYFYNETSEQSTPTAPQPEAEIQQTDPTTPKGGKAKQAKKLAGAAILGNTARQAYSYATSNIGKFTGSTALQSKVDTASQVIGYGLQIAANPIAGSVSLVTNLVIKLVDEMYNRKWERIELNQKRARVGMEVLPDRKI